MFYLLKTCLHNADMDMGLDIDMEMDMDLTYPVPYRLHSTDFVETPLMHSLDNWTF